jgi:hypothetical protein
MSAFNDALRYVADEHNNTVRCRDQLAVSMRDFASQGDVIAAASTQLEIARLNGRIEGLTIATTQLQIVMRRMEQA